MTTETCGHEVASLSSNVISELAGSRKAGSETGDKLMVKPYISEELVLDPEMRSAKVLDFERQLLGKVVGQDRAVRRIVNMYQIYLAGMASPGRPVGNLLFLGPTGSGKTRVVEATAEILFGNPRAYIKIDCAEFQHSHEIAKLIGSPPGYLGHRETPPILTQEAIDQYQTDDLRLSLILFDEIEKANDAVWQLLLGILDKATLTLGDNRKVDLSRCLIFMTSNLGAVEMNDIVHGGIGFTSHSNHSDEELADLDRKLYRTALETAKRKFSPEFMNRLDKIVVFRTLSAADMRLILDIELNEVQSRIMALQNDNQFIFRCSPGAKDLLLREGTDVKYGARHLKRAIERHLVFPLSNLIATGQIRVGDVINIDLGGSGDKLSFAKEQVISGITPSEVTSTIGFAAKRPAKSDIKVMAGIK
jgi:ATP-dependent Clp protease ATP-binding subunit ClpB